jgi:hypothetical protein
MLEDNPLRAWYGEGHVFKAAERGAIGKLLVSDELFRCVLCLLAHISERILMMPIFRNEQSTLRGATKAVRQAR